MDPATAAQQADQRLRPRAVAVATASTLHPLPSGHQKGAAAFGLADEHWHRLAPRLGLLQVRSRRLAAVPQGRVSHSSQTFPLIVG
jgi:hypothetical protein